MTSNINEFGPARRRFAASGSQYGTRRESTRRTAQHANLLVAWLAMIGAFLPAELQLSIAGGKFTAGRIGILLLTVPALVVLLQAGRKLMFSDFLALSIGVWMVGIGYQAGDADSLSSSIALVIEFVGGYFVARAFFFGLPALDGFTRVVRLLVIVLVIFGFVDFISGRWVVHDFLTSLVGAPWLGAIYRGDTVRAASTLDHPILFGTFCAISAALLLNSEQRTPNRILWAGTCFAGCLLSKSSAGLLSFLIVIFAYGYESVMKVYRWRWKLFWSVVVSIVAVIFVVANHPIGWAISHMTIDPVSGFYRILIWDAAFAKMAEAPFTGFGFNVVGNDILDHTVDSVWLVLGLRFGLPMIALVALISIAAILPIARNAANVKEGSSSYVSRMRRAFTVMLLVFMFAGLTVHFWNFMWIFWGLCIGCRVSLRELLMMQGRP